jgi:hypothetical protein
VNSARVVLPAVGAATLLTIMLQPSLLRSHVREQGCVVGIKNCAPLDQNDFKFYTSTQVIESGLLRKVGDLALPIYAVYWVSRKSVMGG